VVTMLATQAYRYRGLHSERPHLQLTAYSTPTGEGRTAVELCYWQPSAAAAARECEQIAEALTPTGQASAELEPDARLAGLLRGTIPALDRERAALRAGMRAAGSSDALAARARTLASDFAAVRARLGQAGKIASTVPGGEAYAQLLKALGACEQAYAQLSLAASGQRSLSYEAALASLAGAEAKLADALRELDLLGY